MCGYPVKRRNPNNIRDFITIDSLINIKNNKNEYLKTLVNKFKK